MDKRNLYQPSKEIIQEIKIALKEGVECVSGQEIHLIDRKRITSTKFTDGSTGFYYDNALFLVVSPLSFRAHEEKGEFSIKCEFQMNRLYLKRDK